MCPRCKFRKELGFQQGICNAEGGQVSDCMSECNDDWLWKISDSSHEFAWSLHSGVVMGMRSKSKKPDLKLSEATSNFFLSV